MRSARVDPVNQNGRHPSRRCTKEWPVRHIVLILEQDFPPHRGMRADAIEMARSAEPVTIKRYANRRLYDTGAGAYVTLATLVGLARQGADVVGTDAGSGEDISRFILARDTHHA